MMRENKTYDEINVGDEAKLKRVLTAEDLYVFAHASGNINPLHLPSDKEEEANEVVAPSMWVGALVSSVLGNILPGAGTLYRSQSFNFIDRAHIGDELTIHVRVTEKRPDNVVVLATHVTGRGGDPIADGVAEVLAPIRKVRFDDERRPTLLVGRHRQFNALVERARELSPLRVAVVAPEAEHALAGAMLAAKEKLITPILVGNTLKIRKAAKSAHCDIEGIEIVDAATVDVAASKAVRLVNAGGADALMKGQLHTDELLHAVVRKDGGLRGLRRLSHVFVMDVPSLDHLLFISDAAINIAPTLEEKVDIMQNAIDLAIALGVKQPRVGVLSAVETVTPKIPSTIDAAVLAKMAERGQIRGGIVDGPLAMDNAVDVEAARTKGIRSLVAGRAEILIAPNLEAGNILAKELTYIAHAESAGIVLGAQAPIILTSRADGEKSRLASCAVAALYQSWLTAGGVTEDPRKEAAE
jgi:phosphate butyryltransferase